MSSNYDKIREDNVREYGEGTRHLAFLNRLYTDPTHFIFELLQNAEDAAANNVLFELFEDRLEMRHDGRPFDERDVRGICGVGEGTKAEDLTQIGKFGIGFKSVYAYTTTPEVHSSGEHFRIEHYVRPYEAPRKEPGNTRTTLFVFHFDVSGLEPDIARRKIAWRLQTLNARTLLFLRSIGNIEYRLPDKTGGCYLREVTKRGQARQVTVIGQNNGQDEDEAWLVFERPVPVPNSANVVLVEIGFRLERAEDSQADSIVKINDSPLVVYFPTEKATRFGFLVQGPYRTTPSRDNIPKDDQWNAKLVEETAVLITEILQLLKEMGLLTISLLEALPIRAGDFPEDGMFNPIVEAVHNALREQELLPAHDGTFVSARNAKLARGADLRKLLTDDQLRTLLQTSDEIKWLSGEITPDRRRDLHMFLYHKLGVKEIDPESFAQRVSADFLSSLDDAWFARFYGFLLNQEALWRAPKYPWETPGILRSKPILRLENGSLVEPFDTSGNPNAYLPVEHEGRFPSVRRAITNHQPALEFLKRLGLPEPDETADVIENILPKYRGDESEKIGEEEYESDLRAILNAMKTDSRQKKRHLIEEARKTPFVKAVNAASGGFAFKKPGGVYAPTDELRVFFAENQSAWFLPDSSHGDDEVWKDLDVAYLPRRIPHKRVPPDIVWERSKEDEISNYDLEGLHIFFDRLTRMPDGSESAAQWGVVLWQLLVSCIKKKADFFEGAYKWFHYTWKQKSFPADFLEPLRRRAWLPTRDSQLKIPTECHIDELHPELEHYDTLIKALQIKPGRDKLEQEDRQSYARALGVEIADVEFVRQHRYEFDTFRRRVESQNAPPSSEKPVFPTRTSANPERREQLLAQQIAEAPDKAYEQRDRNVRTTRSSIDPSVWLRSLYANEENQLFCQICKEEMPFRKRDGEYYFEAVEALSGDHFAKEHEAQFLALCPLCAAKYTEFVKRDEDAMVSFKRALMSAEQPEIPVQLGVLHTSVRFVDTHFHDLKTIAEYNGA